MTFTVGSTGHVTDHNVLRGGNVIFIDDPAFAGASDDAKLTNALTYAAAQSNIPVVVIGRGATFTTPQPRFTGMKVWGALQTLGVTDYELNSGRNLAQRITVNVAAGRAWFEGTGTIYNNSFRNLACTSSNGLSTLFSSTGNDYASDFSNISAYGFLGIFGNAASAGIGKYINTQINVCGTWVVNPILNGGCVAHVGGSDSDFWVTGSLNIGGQTSGAGKPLFWFDGQGKSACDNLYITASQPSDASSWVAIQVSGSVTSMNFRNVRMEGVNASNPTDNCLLYLDSSMGASDNFGTVSLQDCRLAYGMASSTANGRSDGGYIQKDGGILAMSGCAVELSNGQATTTPLLYQSAGEAYVTGILRRGAWGAQRPVVHAAGGTIVSDSSVAAA